MILPIQSTIGDIVCSNVLLLYAHVECICTLAQKVHAQHYGSLDFAVCPQERGGGVGWVLDMLKVPFFLIHGVHLVPWCTNPSTSPF